MTTDHRGRVVCLVCAIPATVHLTMPGWGGVRVEAHYCKDHQPSVDEIEAMSRAAVPDRVPSTPIPPHVVDESALTHSVRVCMARARLEAERIGLEEAMASYRPITVSTPQEEAVWLTLDRVIRAREALNAILFVGVTAPVVPVDTKYPRWSNEVPEPERLRAAYLALPKDDRNGS